MKWLIFLAGLAIGAIIGVIIMALMAVTGREDEMQRIGKRCRDLDLGWRRLAHLMLDLDHMDLHDAVNNELIELGYLQNKNDEKVEG